MYYEFQWFFWPPGEFASVSDEFCVGLLCLRLLGNLLIVETEATTEEEAAVAAEAIKIRYSEALSKYTAFPIRLITLKELSAMPAQAITVGGLSAKEHSRLTTALRKARADLLGAEHEHLRRCYDYLQDAREDEKNALIYLYKLIETVEDFFGGERKACDVLGVREDLKSIKKLANEFIYDQRHAPELYGKRRVKGIPARKGMVSLEQLSHEKHDAPIEATRRVLRSFARCLHERAGTGGVV
jgi:hypothetical protein